MENANLLDTKYDYINILTGTKKKENSIVSSITDHYGEDVVHTFEDMKGFFNDDCKKMQQDFPSIFHRMMLRGRGLAIFDDLMTELADCDLLVPLYTKWTHHSDISSIHITQNIFHRGSGKHQGDNSMLYLSTKYLTLFANPMDISTFCHIARKQDPAHAKELAMLFSQVTKEHHYILCDSYKYTTVPSLLIRLVCKN